MVASRLLISLCVAAPLSGCGGGASANGGRALPPYAGHAADLFDDGIEPLAIGYELDRGTPPKADNLLRERTQVGDGVLRARVTTVTSKREDTGQSWQLGMHTLERLGGDRAPDGDFTLQVAPHDPAAGIVRAFEGRLMGMTFVVFVREFARPGAPPEEAGELRFHIARDDREELEAVRAAVLLGQVR
jgi:hypothetical protein